MFEVECKNVALTDKICISQVPEFNSNGSNENKTKQKDEKTNKALLSKVWIGLKKPIRNAKAPRD